MSTLSALLKTIEAYFRWQTVMQRAKIKFYLFDKMEELEKENEELEEQIQLSRSGGNNLYADRLLQRQVRRTLLRAEIYSIVEESNVQSDEKTDSC